MLVAVDCRDGASGPVVGPVPEDFDVLQEELFREEAFRWGAPRILLGFFRSRAGSVCWLDRESERLELADVVKARARGGLDIGAAWVGEVNDGKGSIMPSEVCILVEGMGSPPI